MDDNPIVFFATQHNLTPRETDLLRVVAKHGYTNEQIAESLKIQRKTVNIHMTKLLSKTGCASSRELLSKIITHLLPDEIPNPKQSADNSQQPAAQESPDPVADKKDETVNKK